VVIPRSRFGMLLVAGFAGLLALLVAAALLGVWQASMTFSRLEQAVAASDKQAALAYAMRFSARERMLVLWKISLSDDPFQREEFYQQFLKFGSQFLTARDGFVKAPLNAAERALIARLFDSAERGGEVNREAAREMIDSGGIVLRQQLLEKSLPAQDRTLEVLDELISIQGEKAREARRRLAEENAENIYRMLGLMTAALMLGGVLTALVYFRDREMLATIGKTTSDLDQANRNLERQVEERTRELTEANNKLEQLAHHDALTGLANRYLLTSQMQLLLAQAARSQERLALLFLDLDGFKEVNDRLGHDAGDALLVEVAEVLGQTTRRADLAARVGGDEFVVVLSAVQDAQQAYGVGKKIIAAWEPHAVRYESIGPVTLSIGISLYPDDADTVEALLRHADNAMYGVKKSGKNGCRLYQRSSVNGSA